MNKDLEKNLQDQLRSSEDGLNAPTLARLHAARNRALETGKGGRTPRWAGGWLTAAAAGVAAIILFATLRQPPDTGPLTTAELESTLLAAAGNEYVSPVTEEPVSAGSDAAETLDLLENLDFYEWLSQEPAEEQKS